MTTPRFIVSTGRCGSTLLSTLLGAHPAALNVSELFAALQPGGFPPLTMSGEAFWAMLAEPKGAWTMALRHRLEPREFAYPVDGGARFTRKTGVPPIAAICLPTCSDEPDLLFRELESLVPTFPDAKVGVLYTSLFEWLTARLGKTVWIERSGGSLAYCGEITAHFERGKYVHLYRNGYDTSVSMSRHVFFRMAVVREMLIEAVGFDPYENARPGAGHLRLTPELARLLPETFDPQAFWRLPIPLDRFGRRWSAMILHGTNQLAKLPESQVCHVSLEQLVAAPDTTLRRLLDFLEVRQPPAAWLDAARASVAKTTSRRRPGTSAHEDERLLRACEPGERRLQRLTQVAVNPGRSRR